jgi:hypothetical protein
MGEADVVAVVIVAVAGIVVVAVVAIGVLLAGRDGALHHPVRLEQEQSNRMMDRSITVPFDEVIPAGITMPTPRLSPLELELAAARHWQRSAGLRSRPW